MPPSWDAGGSGSGEGITRRYLEANVAFFLTAAVTILFLHNWFSLLAQGPDSLDGNEQAWVIWAAVDTLLPPGSGGYRLPPVAGRFRLLNPGTLNS